MNVPTFFRQSAWMLVASVVSGALFTAVHRVAYVMGPNEYGLFCMLLQVLTLMAVPALALQSAFTRETVFALNSGRIPELRGIVRSLLWSILCLGLVAGVLTLLFQKRLMLDYKISNPAALWATFGVGLTYLSSVVLLGTLQGQQNFFWLGSASISNALARLIVVTLAVRCFGGKATGAMSGVLVGMVVVVCIAAWQSRVLWSGPVQPAEWLGWTKQILPLAGGFGAITVLLSVDVIIVRRYFTEEQTGDYAAAGTIARALYYLVAPMAQVLFPKVARSAVRMEQSNEQNQAIVSTTALGIIVATGCTLLPELPLRVLLGSARPGAIALVPLYVWCMLPIAISSLLVNSFLATGRFKAVALLLPIASSYWITLCYRHTSLESILYTLGSFSIATAIVCVAFDYRTRSPSPAVLTASS